ncbi:uncharacterized protein [Epargyreus clarus]|uniref:uncharacterized protein isoform X2 n=1 Tax=Epargyreus clarus TaxID=520877 RepID=UPI003C2C6630
MKKRTISKLKSIFGSKKSKRQHEQQQSAKSSRSPSPEPTGATPSASGESFRPLMRTPPPSRAGPPPSPPVPTHPVAPVPPQPSGPLPLCPCPVCGRTFVPQSLAKHVKICEKMTVKKRKTFDSSRQRREGVMANRDNSGTDLEQYLPKNFGLPENSPFLEKSPPNTAKATPKPKAPSVRSAIMKPTADLQRCPHCNRNFGVRAFERHVEWCADKAKILPAAPAQPPPHIADAKQRLNARTQYKAPLVRGRRSSQSRDKSSNSRSASVESSRGVSPPHPREYGDYRRGRTRASESMSSNDCHEDSSPHIPVIKNSRVPQNNSSGDANVRARQARLARDLSSSRNTQESQPSQIQQSCTDPNIPKPANQNKPKMKINKVKQQQLKKLEEIAKKSSERSQKIVEERKNAKKTIDKKDTQKSQIPIPKLTKNKNTKESLQENVCTNETDSVKSCKETSKSRKVTKSKNEPVDLKEKVKKEKATRFKTKQCVVKQIIDSAISLDSLEDGAQITVDDKNCQSIGINTELLCPCVPCVIHITPDQKQISKSKIKANSKDNDNVKKQIDQSNTTVELLYRNPKMVSSCDIQVKDIYEIPSEHFESDVNVNIEEIHQFHDHEVNEPSSEIFEKSKTVDCRYNSSQETTPPFLHKLSDEDQCNLSGEKLEENYEHDLSEDNFDDSVENEDSHRYSDGDDKGNVELGCRYGSGDTYTKFSGNPTDLEEFIALTDDMLTNNENNEKMQMDNDINNIHTPLTNSIEALNSHQLDANNKETPNPAKHIFSDTLSELKNNFKNLLSSAPKNVNIKFTTPNPIEQNIKVSDMEHIVVYETKRHEQNVEKSNLIKEEAKLKLPSITESNKSNKILNKDCHSRKKLISQKTASKYKLLSQQKRTNREYLTFTVDETKDESDAQSISSEAPPFKLPRIELKSSNNIVGDKLFPSSVKRSTSLLDSLQKKNVQKLDGAKIRHKTDQLEEDLMKSLKDFDKFYENESTQNRHSNKDVTDSNKNVVNGATKKDSHKKLEHRKTENSSNGNYTPNGKASNDSAYSSLNRISPSKLSVCNAKELNGVESLERIPAASETNSSQKDDARSESSEEFLAMERSAELNEPLSVGNAQIPYKDLKLSGNQLNEKRASSRASSRRSPTWQPRTALSSSGSETSLHRARRDSGPPRLSRFCHECGNKFPVDTAKFCIECGVKRLVV